MGSYKDLMHKRSIREYDFSTNQPKPKMEIKTTCERIQPTAETDANGNLIWVGKAMEQWQMAMFEVKQIAGACIGRWLEVFHFQEHDREFLANDSAIPDESKGMPKEGIESRKRMYVKSRKYWNRVNGD